MRKVLFLAGALLFAIIGCSSDEPKTSATVNENAALSGSLPANPLQWRIITSVVDHLNATMSTLYGNDLAVDYARTHSQQDFPAGSVLALVTWTQRADPRWFGARIPEQVKSVEFVTVGSGPDGRPSFSYEQYTGATPKMASAQISATPTGRTAYLLGQHAAVMP